jgi:hypothetical protein
VGTWFGTRQLEAEKTPRRKRSGAVRAARLRRPPGESDEWQLIRVSVGIVEVDRSGETWRAEAELADGSTLPLVGLAGSGIAADLLEPGRSARITGIVRRAHPSATDQRFAVAPRSRKDVVLGKLAVDDGEDGRDDAGGQEDDGGGDGRASGAASDGIDQGVLAATFSSLDALENHLVRVGGRVEAVVGRRLTLDDGTASGTVRLADSVDHVVSGLRVGEVINAVGRVQRHRVRGSEVVVDSAADVRRAASLAGQETVAAAETMAMVGGISGGLGSMSLATEPEEPLPSTMGAGWALPATAALALVSMLLLGSAGFLIWRSGRVDPAAEE